MCYRLVDDAFVLLSQLARVRLHEPAKQQSLIKTEQVEEEVNQLTMLHEYIVVGEYEVEVREDTEEEFKAQDALAHN